MKSLINKNFKRLFSELQPRIKKQAKKNYKLWETNPHHPSLEFKCVNISKNIYSVRVTLGWRAIGIKTENIIVWFWIGTHNDYEKLIGQIK